MADQSANDFSYRLIVDVSFGSDVHVQSFFAFSEENKRLCSSIHCGARSCDHVYPLRKLLRLLKRDRLPHLPAIDEPE